MRIVIRFLAIVGFVVVGAFIAGGVYAALNQPNPARQCAPICSEATQNHHKALPATTHRSQNLQPGKQPPKSAHHMRLRMRHHFRIRILRRIIRHYVWRWVWHHI